MDYLVTPDAETICKQIMGEPEGARLEVALAWIRYLAPVGQTEAQGLAVRYGLSPIQSGILLMLTRSLGEVVPSEELAVLCDERTEAPVKSIYTHVTHLRRALKKGNAPIEIVSMKRVGYYARSIDAA